MFEKVNPMHPDKIADRIAGALVDMAYKSARDPKIAVEVLIGHGRAHVIAETSEHLEYGEICRAVHRIARDDSIEVDYHEVKQDSILAKNQSVGIRCGDNGIFKGVPRTAEEFRLGTIARDIYRIYGTDGKYIINGNKLTICQSMARTADLQRKYPGATINPLGDWTGGTNVDTGATNRKLGSDMGEAVTGGGLHGKDLSKADVAVNIYAHIMAQQTGKTCEYCCSIGDTSINGIPYADIVERAREYIQGLGGFEAFAEWGLR